MQNIAVILAGGMGTRIGSKVPKQLLPLSDGRSVLEHAVDAFEKAPCIDEVCIVMHPDYIVQAEQMLLANAWQKVRHIISGGHERWESSVRAISLYQSKLSNEEFAHANILLHDAARPFISQEIIRNVYTALMEHEAVVVAIASTDTIYEMQGDKVTHIPARATIMRAQTPQAFRLPLIERAYRLALGVDTLTTEAYAGCQLVASDDCGVLFQNIPEASIHIVIGNEQNRKITFKEDI